MATLTKVEDLGMLLATGALNLNSTAGDTLRLHVSNTAPSGESSDPTQDGNGVLANVSTVSTNLNVPLTLTYGTNTQSNGVYSVIVNDATITASGGTGSTFQYIYVYDDTHASDALIGVYDYGSGLALGNGESLQVDFTGALITVT